MIRLRSTDVWYNAPGIVAAYQPVAAPDSLAARQNVGNDLRMAGRHTAQPGVLPTHDPRKGWTLDGTQQYLTRPGLFAQNTWTTIVKVKPTSAGIITSHIASSDVFTKMIRAYTDSMAFYSGGGVRYIYPFDPRGYEYVYAVTQNEAYRNGVSVGSISDSVSTAARSAIGAGQWTWQVSAYCACVLSAEATYSVTLAPAHVAQYSRQMAYCHVNPDWSAWGRRRRYYYAPSAAEGIMWRGVGRNSSPVGGSLGVQQQ